MSRYKKQLYKNYFAAFFEMIIVFLTCSLTALFVFGGVYGLIATGEMAIIIMLELEPGLVVSEIVKWGLGSVMGALTIFTAIGFAVDNFIDAKKEARKKIDDENTSILRALQGNTL